MNERPRLWLHVVHDNRLVRSVPVTRSSTLIGSRPFCDICLPAAGVAPEHVELILAPDGTLGLRSSQPGFPATLSPGEHLSIGDHTVTLEARGESPATGMPLLGHVLELVPRLWEGEDSEAVGAAILKTLLTVFGAQWGAFLTAPSPDDEPVIVHQAGQRPAGAPVAVSRTVIDKAISTGSAVLVADVQADPTLAAALSIPVQIRSVIAAPLTNDEVTRGIVYLESAESGRAYSATEQQLLRQLCDFAADHLERARRSRALSSANRRLEQIHSTQVAREHDPDHLVGSSPAIREVWEQIRQVARTDVTTLIVGETGTGKELVARAIHRLSERRGVPLVAINCMALPDDLVEAELFGHAKGAFSGATADRVGRFEVADRGTLFVDEIGELAPRVQVKLLRVLQERVIQRLGESKERKVDVRLVTATNAQLPELVARGAFREDLFYRVSVFVIRLPPLRERGEDLAALVDHFVSLFNQRLRRRIRGLEQPALDLLRAHSWPGNVRELRNVIEQAFVRENGELIKASSLSLLPTAPSGKGAVPDLPEELEMAKAIVERERIVRALGLESGHVGRAARRLGVSQASLYKKCALHGVDPVAHRS